MNTLCEITDPDEVSELAGQLKDVRSEPAKKLFQNLFRCSRGDFEVASEPPPDFENGRTAPEPPDESVRTAQDELTGLRDAVRLIAQQFNG